MQDPYAESLEMHARLRGKLDIRSKVPLATRDDLSRAYTPGVAEVCRVIARDPAQARMLTMAGNTVAVVTDGSAILGLGNLGPAAALPVMEGKAVLFKEFAGVDAVPLCLATQDVDAIVATVKAVAPTFGGINLEDISAPRCFEVERRLIEALAIPVMHDDQHGTAVVVLAGLINALAVTGRMVSDTRVVVNGAGAAGSGVTRLLLEYGFTDVTVCDSKGIIATSRPDIGGYKAELAARTNPRGLTGVLADAVRDADVFIGLSVAEALPTAAVRTMRSGPIVFALANPVPEIMPDEARAAGAAVVCTGRSDFPNQVNNVLAFPGMFRGILDAGNASMAAPASSGMGQPVKFSRAMFLAAAKALAGAVGAPTAERVLPDPLDRTVAPLVAEAVRMVAASGKSADRSS